MGASVEAPATLDYVCTPLYVRASPSLLLLVPPKVQDLFGVKGRLSTWKKGGEASYVAPFFPPNHQPFLPCLLFLPLPQTTTSSHNHICTRPFQRNLTLFKIASSTSCQPNSNSSVSLARLILRRSRSSLDPSSSSWKQHGSFDKLERGRFGMLDEEL